MTDPIEKFIELFERAKTEEAADATVMALATADSRGRPSVRMVLLKTVDQRGFVFYTNFGSRKAQELSENAQAALCLHWPRLAIQARIEGQVQRVDAAEADAYFASRPRQSQLGAWASLQSTPLATRAALLARFMAYAARYVGRAVPRPDFWGGYRVVPERIEFWYNQDYRLHDRNLYTRDGAAWRFQLLYP